jgi:3-deoxy-D-manno-octulosonate 8-phosphate phosphatase (KDO 8-P phosphatase)
MENLIASQFEDAGGQFILPANELQKKLKGIKALIFDWDGVFHSGYKSENQSSLFSEADSMGVNMLRFSYYLMNQAIPYTAIITGENNKTAFHWAEREHLDDVFYKIKDKVEILNWLADNKGINKEEVLFVFDDILDLSMAKECEVRYLINRSASISLHDYCITNNLCDYISFNDGGSHAIREISELSINLLGNWNEVLEERIKFNNLYAPYIRNRQEIETNFYTIEDGKVIQKR